MSALPPADGIDTFGDPISAPAEAESSSMESPSSVSIWARVWERLRAESVLRAAPTALLMGVAWALAWREGGSVDASDWLPYAVFCALLLVAVLASGRALRPTRAGLVGIGGMLCLAAWTAITIIWSPLPEAARNDALLVALYAIIFVTATVMGGQGKSRSMMLGVVVAGLGTVALATELKLVVTAHPSELYATGRLFFPIGYWNAQAAMFLLGFWPAVALAARRSAPIVLRALSCGAAASVLAGALMVQSKGGMIGLAVSVVAVLAIAQGRLRILLVLALTAVPVVAAYLPLTHPYRLDTTSATDSALGGAIRSAAAWALGISFGVAVLGAVYALVDSRLKVSARARRVISRIALAGLLLVVLGGISATFATVDHPIAFLSDKWQAFKHMPTSGGGSSHLFSLGSNRYDFWRVAGDEFVAHPLGGVGQHGFAAAYLIKGRSTETPQRSHSVFLDQLSETGIVGFVLLVIGLGAPLLLIAKRAHRSILHAGIFGAAVYWIVHASGDWIWTFPAVGIPLFLLLGIGASPRSSRPLGLRVALPAAAAVAVIALLALVPPWLAARFTNDALSATPAVARSDLRWARRLDPLAVDPYTVQSELATTPAASIAALRKAADLEPRSVAGWYELGLEELTAGRRLRARRDLLTAQRLYPRDPTIAEALARTERKVKGK